MTKPTGWLCVLCAGIFLLGALSTPTQADEFDSWLNGESQRAYQWMKTNMSPDTTAPGAVVASPSKQNPNYWFHWVRDAALVMDTVVTIWKNTHSAERKTEAERYLNAYVAFSRANQLTPNRHGGLGIPKFNPDGSDFEGDWGFPQNDGPALRAITLMHFSDALTQQGDAARVRQVQAVIKTDLDYVAGAWTESDVDLWEEVRAHHFHTRMVQRRALIEGIEFATRAGDVDSAMAYKMNAIALTREIMRHWNPTKRILEAHRDIESGPDKPSGLDTAVILGVLQGETEGDFLTPDHDAVISTAFMLQRTFFGLYPINREGNFPGIGIGRYPEDHYDGYKTTGQGNPWFLATSAFAEYSYKLAARLQKKGLITISELNYPYYQYVGRDVSITVGDVLDKNSQEFKTIVQNIRAFGDSFLMSVRAHCDQDSGAMSEQFNRDSGLMQGARHLTWSYASFLTAVWARQGFGR